MDKVKGNGRMIEYRAIYKCRLCGEEFYGMSFCESDISTFYAITTFIMGSNSCEMLYKAPPQIIYAKKQHSCKDGSLGLADFMGFRKVVLDDKHN